MNEKSFGQAFWGDKSKLYVRNKGRLWNGCENLTTEDLDVGSTFRLLLSHSDCIVHTSNLLSSGNATWFWVAPSPYELALDRGELKVLKWKHCSMRLPLINTSRKQEWVSFVMFKSWIKSGFGPSCLSLAVFHVMSFVILCILVLCSVKAVCFSPLHLES